MIADPELHIPNHEFSKEAVPKMLDRVLPEMTFEEEDVVMDVGCAAGDNTRDIILPRIPKLKKLIAIDNQPRMIEFARVHMANEKIEYHIADFDDKSSLKSWEGKISKLFSMQCFHWLKNQKRGFQTVYDLLKPKGEAVLLFYLSTSIWKCYPTIINNGKWNKYLKDVYTYVPESHHLHLGAEYYRKMLEGLGFEVLLCEEERYTYAFKDVAKVKLDLRLHSALTHYIADELKEEFLDDLSTTYVEINGINSEGMPIVQRQVLAVHIKKPLYES